MLNSFQHLQIKMKKVTDQQLAHVLYELVRDSDAAACEERVAEFVRHLATRGLLHRGAHIAAAFEEVARKAAGRERITIETAYPLTEATLQYIQKALELEKADVEVRENRALLGGFIAKTRDRLFDASVKRELARLTSALVD